MSMGCAAVPCVMRLLCSHSRCNVKVLLFPAPLRVSPGPRAQHKHLSMVPLVMICSAGLRHVVAQNAGAMSRSQALRTLQYLSTLQKRSVLHVGKLPAHLNCSRLAGAPSRLRRPTCSPRWASAACPPAPRARLSPPLAEPISPFPPSIAEPDGDRFKQICSA